MTHSSECWDESAVAAFLPGDETVSSETVEGVERITRIPGRRGKVVLLPDLDQKSKNPYPTGLAIAFDDSIVPTAIGASINCGTVFARTDITADDVSPERWRELLAAIDARVREYDAEGASMSREGVLRAALDPMAICREAGYSEDEVARVEASGYRLSDELDEQRLEEVLPEFTLRAAELSMGQLGSGNHFIEFQAVEDATGPAAGQLGMATGDLTLALHSSPPLGPLVALMYSARPELIGVPALKMLVRKTLFHLAMPAGMDGMVGTVGHRRALDAEGPLGRAFRAAYDAGAASGYAHRALLIAIVRELVGEHLDGSIEVVCDLSHNGIWREAIDGGEAWVHRHGACSFRPKEHFAEGHPYAATGQPVFVGSSMHSPSGLFVPGGKPGATLHSISHGTGRVYPHEEFAPEELTRELSDAGVEAWWSGHGHTPPTAYPKYRPLDDVAGPLAAHDVAELAARLMPRAVYKI